MCVSKQHCCTLGRSSRALWHASLDCCGGTTLASTGAREGGRADSSGLQATHNNVQERRWARGPWAVGYPDAGEVWLSMKIAGCGPQWADCTPSMRPGPLGTGRLLEQDHTIPVIAQLPDEVESWFLRVTRTLMTTSPSLIILAGWHTGAMPPSNCA